MNDVLVDTNVLSELFKKTKSKAVLDWLEKQDKIGVSSVTVDELLFGLYYLGSSKYLNWFKIFLDTRLQIYTVDLQIVERAAFLRAGFKKRRQQRTQADMLIAGTAFVHNLTIVTRNEKDFLDCQIPIYNPFQS